MRRCLGHDSVGLTAKSRKRLARRITGLGVLVMRYGTALAGALVLMPYITDTRRLNP